MFFIRILVIYFILVITIFSQDSNQRSAVVLNQIRIDTLQDFSPNISKLLRNELTLYDSLNIYTETELDSVLKYNNTDKIFHNISTYLAIGEIINSKFIIQVINESKTDSINIKFNLLNTKIKKFTSFYNLNMLQDVNQEIKDSIKNIAHKIFQQIKVENYNDENKKYRLLTRDKYINRINKKFANKSSILVQSDYEEAIVEFDSVEIGKTPILIQNVKYGSHKIVVKNLEYNFVEEIYDYYYSRKQFIKHNINIAPTWIRIDIKPEDSEVRVNKRYFNNSLRKLVLLSSSPKNLKISSNGYYTLKKKIIPKPFESIKRNFYLEPKSKNLSLLFSTFFPGIGQIYRDDYIYGFLFAGLEIASLISLNNLEQKLISENKKYYQIVSNLNYATQIAEIQKLEEELEVKYKELKKHKKNRDINIGISIGIWALNLIEAYLWNEKPFLGKSFDLSIQPQKINADFTNLTLKYKLP